MSKLAATRALMELGVFDAIPTGGNAMTADELAARTGGEKELIGECHLAMATSLALGFQARLLKGPNGASKKAAKMFLYSPPHEECDHTGTFR